MPTFFLEKEEWGHPLVGPCQQALSPCSGLIFGRASDPFAQGQAVGAPVVARPRRRALGVARKDAHQSPIRIKAEAGRALLSEPRRPLAALAVPDNDRFPAVSMW